MTTPPSPEQLRDWRYAIKTTIATGYTTYLLSLLREAVAGCEALIAERDHARTLVKNLQDMVSERNAERDQALARVKELEAEPGSFASWVAERHRAEKAEARVAELEAHFASCQECSDCLKECGHD